MKKVFFLSFIFLALSIINYAQVTSVNYQMKYNADSSWYDCYVIINAGSATATPENLAFNCQYSIVADVNDSIIVVKNYLPIKSNGNPINWSNSSYLKGLMIAPTKSFWSITPDLSGFPYYPFPVLTGDTLKLFSLKRFGPASTTCGKDLRIFINYTDPKATDPGMESLDFSNGFTIGNPTQIYNRNAPQIGGDTFNLSSILPQNICVGSSFSIPNSPIGVWSSSNPTVATVINGVITAQLPGSTIISFQDTILNCSASANINISSKPIISLTGSAEICLGETTTFSSNSGGYWVSDAPSIAVISNSGLVTGLGAGIARFKFINLVGCESDYSVPITIYPKPIAIIIGSSTICVGETSQVAPSSGGSWASSIPAVATVSNNGLITGISPGTCLLVYTNFEGCVSDPLSITVNVGPTIISSGVDKIKVGETTILTASSPSTTWSSSDLSIATINADGLVTGLSEGVVQIIATDIATGCKSNPFTITVSGRYFKISGFAFTDLNLNNIFDANQDFALPNVAVKVEGDSITYYTNNIGYFDIKLDSGSNVVSYIINFGSWLQDTIVKNITINNPQTYVFVGFKPLASNSTTAISTVTSSSLQCKTFANLYAQAFNTSSKLLDGYLVVEFDDQTYISETNPLPSGGEGHYLVWDFHGLAPGKIFSPDIKFWVPDPINNPDSLYFKATVINSINGDTLNSFSYGEEINCNANTHNRSVSKSYPDREGDDNYTLVGEDITYQVNFKNGISSKATSIKIASEVDPNLELTSVIIQKASLDFKVTSIGNQLIFEADSINLFGANRDGNNEGYLTYSLSQKPNLANHTLIYHKAKIELDNGYVTTTDQVLNTIVNELPCDLIHDEIVQIDNTLEVSERGEIFEWYLCNTNNLVGNNQKYNPSDNGGYYCVITGQNCKTITPCYNFIRTDSKENLQEQIILYPNPVKTLLNIDGVNSEVAIYNLIGKQILSSQDNQVDVSTLIEGVYFARIKTKTGIQIYKFIKED